MVGAAVVGASVVGATVVGATVVGATVVGAAVVGATVGSSIQPIEEIRLRSIGSSSSIVTFSSENSIGSICSVPIKSANPSNGLIPLIVQLISLTE